MTQSQLFPGPVIPRYGSPDKQIHASSFGPLPLFYHETSDNRKWASAYSKWEKNVLWEKENVWWKALSSGLIHRGLAEEDPCGRSCSCPAHVHSGFIPVACPSQTLNCQHHVTVRGAFALVPKTYCVHAQDRQDTSDNWYPTTDGCWSVNTPGLSASNGITLATL